MYNRIKVKHFQILTRFTGNFFAKLDICSLLALIFLFISNALPADNFSISATLYLNPNPLNNTPASVLSAVNADESAGAFLALSIALDV